jgi:hypothetical protein
MQPEWSTFLTLRFGELCAPWSPSVVVVEHACCWAVVCGAIDIPSVMNDLPAAGAGGKLLALLLLDRPLGCGGRRSPGRGRDRAASDQVPLLAGGGRFDVDRLALETTDFACFRLVPP